jgi:hypothetical protein
MAMDNQPPLPLFRQEALDHASQRSLLSHVLLTTPIRFWTSTLTLLGFTAVGLSLSMLIEVPRNTELPGQVETSSNPSGKVSAQLWVDANTTGTLHPGQEVQVKYDAFPFQTYGVFKGKVKAIAEKPINPSTPQKTGTTRLYPVEVELQQQHIPKDSKLIPLKSGMTLTANIVLERKTLWNWLMEPLMGGKANG